MTLVLDSIRDWPSVLLAVALLLARVAAVSTRLEFWGFLPQASSPSKGVLLSGVWGLDDTKKSLCRGSHAPALWIFNFQSGAKPGPDCLGQSLHLSLPGGFLTDSPLLLLPRC